MLWVKYIPRSSIHHFDSWNYYSRKTKPNDSGFQLSYCSRRKRFALLAHVFIRVRKMRPVFSFLSLRGKVGQGEEQALTFGKLRMTKDPNSKPTPTPSWHPTLAAGPPSSAPTRSRFLGTAFAGSSPCLWATRGAHLRPPLVGHRTNPSLLVNGAGFNFPSCVLLLPRGWQGDGKIQRTKYTSLHPPK